MAFLNTGTVRTPAPPSSDACPHQYTPLEEYDHNCVFPLRELRSDKLLVTPFIPSLHAQLYLDGTNEDPDEIFKWFSVGPHSALSEVLLFLEGMRKNPSTAFFALYDLTSGPEPTFAGVLKLCDCDSYTLIAEVGRVIILPSFRRTHVLTHALSLLFTYCFTPPHPPTPSPSSSESLPSGGLGLRRLQWTANPGNTASRRAALRMGFTYEGTLRNQWVYPLGKGDADRRIIEGVEMELGDGRERGRVAEDCWMSSVTKGDWEEGGVRELVGRQMGRES